MRPIQIVILVAFGLVCFVAVIVFLNSSGPDIMYPQAFLQIMTRTVGLFVSTVAALSTLMSALGVLRAKQIAAYAIAMTGGLLLIEPHWSIAIAFGAIVVSLLVREVFLPADSSSTTGGKPTDFTKM